MRRVIALLRSKMGSWERGLFLSDAKMSSFKNVENLFGEMRLVIMEIDFMSSPEATESKVGE